MIFKGDECLGVGEEKGGWGGELLAQRLRYSREARVSIPAYAV